MSAMLGAGDHGDSAMDSKEINKTTEDNKKKKETTSIKTFFKNTEAEKMDKNASSKNNIRNFFLPSPPAKQQESVKQLCDNDVRCKADTEEYIIDNEEENKLTTEEVANLTKKSKPKWSLNWKMSKKSKYQIDSDSGSDFEEVTDSCDKQNEGEENKLDKTKDKEKSKPKKKRKDKVKTDKLEEDKKSNAGSEVVELVKEKLPTKDILLSDKAKKKKENVKQLKSTAKESSSALNEVEKSKKDGSSISVEGNSVKSNDSKKEKKKNNALDILMNKSRKTETKPSENSPRISEVVNEDKTVEKDDSNDCDISLEIIDCTKEGHKEQSKGSAAKMSTTNAFDVLMMKKAKNENVTTKTESPKTTKPKPNAFKLNIRYSKPASDSESEIEQEGFNEDCDKADKIEQESQYKKKKKELCMDKEKNKDNENLLLDKGVSSSSTDMFCEGKVKKSSKKRESKQPSKEETETKLTKIKKKKAKPEKHAEENSQQDNVSHAQEDSKLSIGEIPDKVTNKKKKSHKKSRKAAIEISKHDATIDVQEDSNSSIQEMPEEVTKKNKKSHKRSSKEKTKQSKIIDVQEDSNSSVQEVPAKNKESNEKSSIVTSPGSEDFEVTPIRTSLRKRTSNVNYSLMNEFGTTAYDSKKTKKENETKREKNKKGNLEEKKKARDKKDIKEKESKVVIGDNTDVEVASDKKEKTKKLAAAPQKLAPIFLKQKPKEKPKSDKKKTEKSVEITATKTSTESTKEKPQQTLNDEELKAANSAFLAMFSSSKAVKMSLKPAVEADQQPAPWPTVSHVTQWSEEDQSENRLEEGKEGLKFAVREEIPTDKPKISSRKLKLGKLTSLNDDKILDNNKKKVEDLPNDPLGPAVVKKLLVESSSYYPGIPLRRLYKQYKTKQDENQVETIPSQETAKKEKAINCSVKEETVVEGGRKKRGLPTKKIFTQNDEDVIEKEQKLNKVKDSSAKVKGKDEAVEEGKRTRGRSRKNISSQSDEGHEEKETKDARKKKRRGSSAKEEEEVVEEGKMRKGRSKRKISTQSDEELSEKQLKKVRRKKDKDKIVSEDKKEVVVEETESERPRKKRGREEDDEEQVDNSKRKSSRKGKVEKKQEEKDQKQESSKRKKRKTMENEIEVQSVSTNVKSEDSRTSTCEKKVDLLWTEKYQPECSSEVMGNASSVNRLKSWLEAWKIKREKTLRKELELQKKLLAKQKNKDKPQDKKSSQEWWEEDYDSDFHLSDEDSGCSDSEESRLSSAMLIVGPRGSAKTATVYACAKELGYKVFEVNCSSKRSNKQILSKLEEATQSHLVLTNSTANTPKASAFGGLFANITNKPNAALSHFMGKDEKEDVKNVGKKKTGKEKTGKGNVKDGKEPSGLLVGGESDVNTRLKLKAVSLILFEEVDLVFADDKGFWSAVSSFINNAKCPIIMTSNDSRVDCDGRYEQLIFKTPSINLLSAHLQLTALINNIYVHPNELKTLVSLYKCDIRKCLLALQLWITSGGGSKIKWKKFLKEKKNENGSKEECGKVSVKVEDSSTPQEQALAVLDNGGEESLMLTADDWKTLTKRHTRGYRRGQEAETEDIDSDFEAPKTYPPAVDENTHTDSMLVESSESISIQVLDDDQDKGVAMPRVHCMFVEHVLGLLNHTLGYKHGSVDLLKYRDDANKISPSIVKQRLTEYSQSQGINLISSNLPSLLPSLHPKQSTNENTSTVTKETTQPITNTNIDTLDRNVFDDGSESNQGDDNQATETMATKDAVSRDTTGKHTLDKDKHDVKADAPTKEIRRKTLELFTAMAEDLSYMDALTTNPDLNEYQPAEYGWWHARASAGLTDDAITVNRTSRDWWTRDSSVCIRGTMETASLDCSYSRYKTIGEVVAASNGEVDGGGVLPSIDDLPCRSQSTVVNLNELSDAQLSNISSTNKLYRTVNSSLPLVTISSRRPTCIEYLPTLRSICHSERLREIGNTKRRFLHYLDSIPTMSNSTLQSLADDYLVS